MSLFLKVVLVCVLSTVLTVLIKKNVPEMVPLIAIAALLACLGAGSYMFEELAAHIKEALSDSISFEYFIPLLKCCCISVISQISTNLCKDAGQASIAIGLEYIGNMISIICLFPLLEALFNLIGGLI